MNQNLQMVMLHGNYAWSQKMLLIQRKRAITINLDHILEVIVGHHQIVFTQMRHLKIEGVLLMEKKYCPSVILVLQMDI